MNLEGIILELMGRIQVLEEESKNSKKKIADLENLICSLQASNSNTCSSEPESPSQVRMTDEMINACYISGRRIFAQPGLDIGTQASEVAAQTGMNRSSAIMYIYAVMCMLKGEVYKRAINVKATEHYLNRILSDDGVTGLRKALHAAQGHIAYRQGLGHAVDSLTALCDRFQQRLA